eukprot:UN27544
MPPTTAENQMQVYAYSGIGVAQNYEWIWTTAADGTVSVKEGDGVPPNYSYQFDTTSGTDFAAACPDLCTANAECIGYSIYESTKRCAMWWNVGNAVANANFVWNGTTYQFNFYSASATGWNVGTDVIYASSGDAGWETYSKTSTYGHSY